MSWGFRFIRSQSLWNVARRGNSQWFQRKGPCVSFGYFVNVPKSTFYSFLRVQTWLHLRLMSPTTVHGRAHILRAQTTHQKLSFSYTLTAINILITYQGWVWCLCFLRFKGKEISKNGRESGQGLQTLKGYEPFEIFGLLNNFVHFQIWN